MQRLALEHAQLVTRIESVDAEKLIDDLITRFNLSRNGAITLANYMPDSTHEIRQLLAKEATLKETETLEEILSALMAVKKIDKKDTSYTEALERLDQDNEVDEELEKEIDETEIPDDI